MTMYHARVVRENGFWVAVVDGVIGGATESRRLAALDGEVHDLLAGLLDVDENSFDVEYDYDGAFSAAASKSLFAFRDARAQLELAEGVFEHERMTLVTELHTDGVSLRDTAELVGVSFQRVQQLLADDLEDHLSVSQAAGDAVSFGKLKAELGLQ